MQVRVVQKSEFPFDTDEDWVAFPVFEGTPELSSDLLSSSDASALRRLAERGALTGKAEKVLALPTPQGPYHGVLALGLGKRDSFQAETLRRCTGVACETLEQHRVRRLVFDVSLAEDLSAAPLVEGLMLGQYRFDRYKADQEPNRASPVVEALCVVVGSADRVDALQQRCDRASAACRNANWARDLANAPSNELTPVRLAEIARAMADEAGCSCRVLDEKEMEKLGMAALLGVARGSVEPPRLLCLAYTHTEGAKPLAMVGKGVTFDTGGISLKPRDDMHEMKYDMCGAAAVLGAMKTICELKLSVNMVCVVPAAENMPGAAAQKPGDVVRAYNGKTIEVHDTDAEGRLVLADAIAYTMEQYKPKRLVDVATLTGACVTALGHYAAGLMTNDDSLGAELQRASEESGERVWRLPLWDDYNKLIEGTHADLCNIGPKSEAGTIVGGCFLKSFAGDTPWAHLDIAGTAWGAKNISYLDPKQASGYGVRLLAQWALNEAEDSC